MELLAKNESLRVALLRIEQVAEGRDTEDGFPRSKDEKLRRLVDIAEICRAARAHAGGGG